VHIVIAGAGIGGISAALACRLAGFEVTLLEQTRELREVGAGVQISSNGTVALRKLGILDEIEKVAVKPISFRVLSFESGEIIADFPLGRPAADRYGETFFQIHRADLLDILAAALPDGVLRTGCRVAHIEQDSSCATAVLENGERVSGDIVIGADGIHSAVRKSLGLSKEATFSGKLVWRALVPAARIESHDFKERFYGYAGRDRMVWAYWVRPGSMFNFGGVVPSGEVRAESWNETGDLAELRASFANANPRLAGLIGAIDEAFITGLYDRDPLPSWTKGRVTLLGDSAHAMLPYLAQGACQSLEDAIVLAECLSRRSTDPVAALGDYEIRRRPRTTKVQSTARATSIFWLEKDPVQISARNGRMRGLAQIDPLAATVWKWLYAYDPVESGRAETVMPDKRGIRRQYPEDSPEQQRAWNLWHDIFTEEDEAQGLRGLRRGYDRFFGAFLPTPAPRTSVTRIGDAGGIWVEPEADRGERVVLHMHGGGYCFGSAECSVEYAARLATAAKGRCLALEYRLAPEHPFPAALEDAKAAYRMLLRTHSPEDIFFSGESAGAGLAIAAAMSLRDEGARMPAGIIALSPFVDCSLTSDSIDRLAGVDPIVERDTLTYMVTNYFQSACATDPLISPIFGDFEGLPRLLIQAGRMEVLVDEATRLENRAKQAGVDVRLELYDERLHIFSMFPFLPNAEKALLSVAAFIENVK
jgi:salicylate hydroxylase